MEQLLYEINGIKYVLMEDFITTNNSEEIKAKIKKHEGIQQGVKEISRGGFFSSPYLVIKVLIPEKNIIAWNNDAEGVFPLIIRRRKK